MQLEADYRALWSSTRDRLVSALADLGYPGELGNIIAEHIGSPKGMERMISYLNYVRTDRIELIADEMMSIKSDIDRWRELQESRRANSGYNLVINNGPYNDED